MIRASFQGRLGAFALDATFSVPDQGVTVLFGPSGSGKTTILRCLAGLARLGGRLEVSGEVWQDAGHFTPVHRRRVGYVFQDAALFDHMSVRGNLLYGRRRAGLGPDATFDHLVELLGLNGLLERTVGNLSGGERQRVAIGRALLAAPRLLLMDEPLASLDGDRKDEVIPYLEALKREASIPVIYVTHDVAEAARLADRTLWINDGRVVERSDNPASPKAPDARKLQARLAEVGASALVAELVRAGAPDAVATLAVEALAARAS
jgi:molybdate transport system ATP-binding protein